jgi:hypothetical protein
MVGHPESSRVRDHLIDMGEERPSDVLSSLPHSRAHRRSNKRALRPVTSAVPSSDGPGAARPEPNNGASNRHVPTAPNYGAFNGGKLESNNGASNGHVSAAKNHGALNGEVRRQPDPGDLNGHSRAERSPTSSSGDVPRDGDRSAVNGHARSRPGPSASNGDAHDPPADDAAPATPLLATAVEAAAELAEICLTLGARAIRAAVARLPRP